MRHMFWLALAGFVVIVQAGPSFARGDQPHAACDLAAQAAANSSGVPLPVLLSIARVETGTNIDGRLNPWPWTVNVAGKGYFFDNKDDALAFSAQEIDSGNINFDVGCFQVNLRWHSKGFTSLEDAFDPLANATYASAFLTQLFHETGNWADAVAAYHSRTPTHANSYLEKVRAVWDEIQGRPPSLTVQAPQDRPQRINTFPLLQTGVGTNGSLVPQDSGNLVQFGLN